MIDRSVPAELRTYSVIGRRLMHTFLKTGCILFFQHIMYLRTYSVMDMDQMHTCRSMHTCSITLRPTCTCGILYYAYALRVHFRSVLPMRRRVQFRLELGRVVRARENFFPPCLVSLFSIYVLCSDRSSSFVQIRSRPRLQRLRHRVWLLVQHICYCYYKMYCVGRCSYKRNPNPK